MNKKKFQKQIAFHFFQHFAFQINVIGTDEKNISINIIKMQFHLTNKNIFFHQMEFLTVNGTLLSSILNEDNTRCFDIPSSFCNQNNLLCEVFGVLTSQ